MTYDEYSADYRRGRTTNEVLFEAGEIDNFEAAARARNAKGMTAALVRSGVPHSEAEKITATTLESPETYGF